MFLVGRMKRRIVIIGTGNTAEIVYRFICQYDLFEVVGFAIDQVYIKAPTFLSLPVYPIEELDKIVDFKKDFAFCALMWNSLNGDRRRVYERLKNRGVRFANLISPSAVVNGRLEGDNCWVCDYAKIDWNTVVASNVIIKSFAFIGDNTNIEDHCFIAEHTTIGGGVRIGEQSFVGLGATVFDEVKVGKKCIVGAATALKRNLPDFSVFKTNSENFIVKSYTEDVIENKLLFSKNIR